MSAKKIFFLFAISFAYFRSAAQDKNDVAVAFYNCENFFDTIDNPLKKDEEFTPHGKYRYTKKTYLQKLHNIATVINSMEGGDGPAVIGLAEVENSNVLNDLAHQPELAWRGYKYEWADGSDPRGINVALMYNPLHFNVIKTEALHVGLAAVNPNSNTRDILHVYGVLSGDSVHIFVCHWPSRRGDADESATKRERAAEVEKKAVQQIVLKNPDAKIILMGDFNDNPVDRSITQILEAKTEATSVKKNELYNPWADMYKSGAGTETYKHSWNLFDQIIISGALLHNRNHKLHYSSAAIYKPGFIIDHYKGHDGEPHRSFAGTYWINGYSDHFPVILYLAR